MVGLKQLIPEKGAQFLNWRLNKSPWFLETWCRSGSELHFICDVWLTGAARQTGWLKGLSCLIHLLFRSRSTNAE